MTSAAISKLYASIGTALFLFSVNLFWLERTGESLLQATVPHAQKPSAILLGELAISIVSLFLLWIVQRHWSIQRGVAPVARLPLAFIERPEKEDALTTTLRIIAFLAFVVFPAYVAARFIIVLGNQSVFDLRSEFHDMNFWTMSWAFLEPGTFSGDNRFRFAEAKGVAFFPTLEPIVISLLVAAQCGWAVYQAVSLVVSSILRTSSA
jgi:hypothetical protein